jgi:carbonic anhydrase
MLHPCRLKTLLLIILAALAFSLSSVAQVGTCTSATCWSYSSPTGPSSWAGLTPFAYCNQANNTAQQQSPINIGTPQVNTSLTLGIHYNGVQVPVEDLGYTIEADYGSGSSQNYVTYGGTKYNLLQFHFHQPSEHQIGGTGASMEVHLVHRAALANGNTDPNGAYLVVGVLINVPTTGGYNPGFDKVMTAYQTHNKPEQTIDPIQMIPGTANVPNINFYNYAGSLTTPPCTPGVTWMVLQKPITVSQDQLNQIPYPYPNSSRGVQATITGLSLVSNFQP